MTQSVIVRDKNARKMRYSGPFFQKINLKPDSNKNRSKMPLPIAGITGCQPGRDWENRFRQTASRRPAPEQVPPVSQFFSFDF